MTGTFIFQTTTKKSEHGKYAHVIKGSMRQENMET
jgi:hypothetical protein